MPMDILLKVSGVGHTEEALADAARVMAVWRDALSASGGPFLFGHFSVADAMFAPVATRFQTYGVPLDAPCHAYVETMLAHPAFLKWKGEAIAERQI
jgi:glutathione S-transferase